MGADMFAAYIASLPNANLDWDAGTAALNTVADPAEFDWEPDDLEELLGADDDVRDQPSFDTSDLTTLKAYGLRVLTKLKRALEGRGTTELTIGGYCIYLTGGLSWGDEPSDEYGVICASGGLPDSVLKAIGFCTKPWAPPSRRAGAQGDLTDTDIVDAIALGLGTKTNWQGRDELTWIADAIGKVRPHPHDADPVEYYEVFVGQSGFDPLEDGFLGRHVGEQRAEDGQQQEEADR
jgi:hypothetical protein